MRLAGVLDHREPVAVGDLLNRVHVARLAVEVHRHDGRGEAVVLLGGRLEGGRVDERRVLEAVDEHGHGADVAHGLGGGDERVDRHEHLVAGPHVRRQQRQLDRVGARADADGVLAAAERGEGGLELLELRARACRRRAR